jgi:DNA polymerase-3 subunit epsilon
MLKHVNLERPLVCFDLETTGVSPERDRIVEIGLVRVEPDGSRRAFRTLVNPEMPIPPQATAVHGISDADVHDAPSLAGVARELLVLLDGADLAGFNSIGFDAPLLENELRRVGVEFSLEGRRHVDAMRIFHRMEPRTLTAAYRKYCGKDLTEAHAALADVEATLEVLDAMVGRYEELGGDVGELHAISNPNEGRWVDRTRKFEWNDDGLAVFTFGKHRGKSLDEVARAWPDYLEWMLGKEFTDEVLTILREALDGKFPEKR